MKALPLWLMPYISSTDSAFFARIICQNGIGLRCGIYKHFKISHLEHLPSCITWVTFQLEILPHE